MHIPPYFKKRHWQWLIIGLCFGASISYALFIFMYGVMYEKLLEENFQLITEVTELEERNKALLQDQQQLDEQKMKLMTIDSIDIHLENAEQMGFDRLAVLQLKELIKREVSHIIGKDIESISDSDELLVKIIENKPFKVGDFFYYFQVIRLTIGNKVKISVQAKHSQD